MSKDLVTHILNNKESNYGIDAKKEYSKLSKDEVDSFFKKMPYNQPHLLNDGKMAICLLDIGSYLKLGELFQTYSFRQNEKFAPHRDQFVNVISELVNDWVKKYEGHFQGVTEGDKIVYGFGIDPHFSSKEHDPMDQAILCSLEIMKGLYNSSTEKIKHLLVARELELSEISIDKITDTEYEKAYTNIHKKIGEATGTGREGRVRAKVAICYGPNLYTVSKFRETKGIIERDKFMFNINGPTTDLAGRLFDVKGKSNDEIWVAYNQKTEVIQESRQKPNDFFIFFEGESSSYKNTPLHPFQIIGVHTFEHPNFHGKIPDNSFVLKKMIELKSKVFDVHKNTLIPLSEKYISLGNLDVPEMQRRDLFDHGLAKTSAVVVAGLYEGINRIINYVDRNNLKNSEYKSLKNEWKSITKVGYENMILYTLVHNLSRYHESKNEGLIIHATRYVEELEKTKGKLFANKSADILDNIKEFENTIIPTLTRERYTPYETLLKNNGHEISASKDLIGICEDYIKKVTPCSYREAFTQDDSLEFVKNRYAKSKLVEPFLLIMGKETQHYKKEMLE